MDLSAETLRKITQADHLKLKQLAERLERYKQALIEVRNHHTYINSMRGRPLSESKTIAICNRALSGGPL